MDEFVFTQDELNKILQALYTARYMASLHPHKSISQEMNEAISILRSQLGHK